MLYRIKIWIRVLYSLILTFPGVMCKVLDAEDTVQKIREGKSLIRFGDGEFGIYNGKSIHYQQFSDDLKNKFEEIKSFFEIEGENCPYLLAVPKKYMQCTGFALCKKRVLVSSWAEARNYFKKNFNLNKTYGDAFLFERKNVSIYENIWNAKNDSRTIIFIHNNRIYAEQFQKKYKREVLFIQCPTQNAFEQIEKLENVINNLIALHNLGKENVQIVVSAGPTGKILVYQFSRKGYHSIDAGHCWDDPLESE